MLKVACKWPTVRFESEPESYESLLFAYAIILQFAIKNYKSVKGSSL